MTMNRTPILKGHAFHNSYTPARQTLGRCPSKFHLLRRGRPTPVCGGHNIFACENRLELAWLKREWRGPGLMRPCGEAGREREVRRVSKCYAHFVLKREASSCWIDARWVRRKSGRMNRLRWVLGDEQWRFKPEGRRVGARIGFGEPTAVIVDPNAHGSPQPSAFDNQIKVVTDAVDVASDDQQPAFRGVSSQELAAPRRVGPSTTRYRKPFNAQPSGSTVTSSRRPRP